VLMNHIRDKLPDMKARLNTLMGQTQQELDSFGDTAVFGDENSQGALILRLMTQFARDFISSIEGTSLEISTKELCGGARIYYIFNDVFGSALQSINATQNLDSQDIRTAIRNSTGPRPSLFVPEVAFELLVKPQIKLLESPSLRCVELVYEELVRICHNCSSVELQRFPRLQVQIIEVVSELLRERLGPTSEYTQSLIAIQAAYINTNHPAFVASSVAAAAAKRATSPPRPKTLPQRPSSTEPINGALLHSADEEDDSDSVNTPMTPRDGRSTSTSVRDRSRLSSASGTDLPSSSAGATSTARTRSRPPQHRTHHPQGTSRPASASAGTLVGGGASQAKETFLGYFFGAQNGAQPNGMGAHGHDSFGAGLGGGHGANASASLSAAAVGGVSHIGRELAQSPPLAGLMAGKLGPDGNSAAFDMKSLGKHIEALPSDGNVASHSREEMETSLIRNLIQSYFNIVRQTIQDLVPKAIMHFLVNNSSQQVQNRLVSSLYKPPLFKSLLNEDEGIVAERTRVKALLDAYKEAFKTLSEVNLKTS